SRRSFAIPVMYGESGGEVSLILRWVCGASLRRAGEGTRPYVGGVSFPSGHAGFPRGGGPSSLGPGLRRDRCGPGCGAVFLTVCRRPAFFPCGCPGCVPTGAARSAVPGRRVSKRLPVRRRVRCGPRGG